jgi:N-acetylmuramoyl-L-alanine amidase
LFYRECSTIKKVINNKFLRIYMKKILFLSLVVALAITVTQFAFATDNSLYGTVIALDAGHGGGETGAQYPANCFAENPDTCLIFEEDVNFAVVNKLEQKLVDAGAIVVFTDRVANRKARVDSALAKCKASPAGRKCDVLLSVHHNGNIDSSHDGTLVIYNEKRDVALATAIHDALIAGLGLPDEEYLHGGYGMTVYGNTVSALTEGYYITNDCEAQLYLFGTTNTPSCDNKTLYPDGDRIEQEAEILKQGLENYFNRPNEGPGGGKGKKPN